MNKDVWEDEVLERNNLGVFASWREALCRLGSSPVQYGNRGDLSNCLIDRDLCILVLIFRLQLTYR
jgi:hypothetical protein